MGCCTAVGVHDDLTASETGVADRTAHDKPASGVHEEPGLRTDQFLGQSGTDDLFNDGLPQVLDVDIRVVLGGDNDGGAPGDVAILVVGHGDLALAVGTHPGQGSVLTQLGHGQGQVVGQGDGCGHQLVGLVTGVTKHHALVAGTDQVRLVLGVFLVLEGVVNAHGDVGGLLVQGGQNGAGLSVKAVGRVIVADAVHGLADDGGDVHLGSGADLAHHQHHTGGGGSLTGHAGSRILSQNIVQHCVRDLIAHLIRMAFGHRFRSKYMFSHSCLSFLYMRICRFARETASGKKEKKTRSTAEREMSLSLIFRYFTAGISTLRKICTGCWASSGRSLHHS